MSASLPAFGPSVICVRALQEQSGQKDTQVSASSDADSLHSFKWTSDKHNTITDRETHSPSASFLGVGHLRRQRETQGDKVVELSANRANH